jgi:hypothetical protein
MIESPVYRLRPPLRRSQPVLRATSSERSGVVIAAEASLLEEAPAVTPTVGTTPDTSPSRVPPSPPKGVSTADAHPERVFLCCVCGKRAVGRVPYGWLRLLRSVHPDSMHPSCLLIRRDRRGRAKYADLLVCIFCGADCMEKAMSRVIDFVRELAAREVGMKPLSHGELVPELPYRA